MNGLGHTTAYVVHGEDGPCVGIDFSSLRGAPFGQVFGVHYDLDDLKAFALGLGDTFKRIVEPRLPRGLQLRVQCEVGRVVGLVEPRDGGDLLSSHWDALLSGELKEGVSLAAAANGGQHEVSTDDDVPSSLVPPHPP